MAEGADDHRSLEPEILRHQVELASIPKDQLSDSHNDGLRMWRAETQMLLEQLKQKLKESEEVRECQRHTLLQSQMSLEQVSLRYDSEMKSRDKLKAKVEHVLNICQILQEYCKTLENAYNRMEAEKNELAEHINMGLTKSIQLLEGFSKLHMCDEHIESLTSQIQQELKNHESEMSAIREECEKKNYENKIFLEELNTEFLQMREQRMKAQDQLATYKSTEQELKEGIKHKTGHLEKQKADIEKKIIDLQMGKEAVDKMLQETKGRNSSLEVKAQEKFQIEEALVAAREDMAALNKDNEILEEKIQELLTRIEQMQQSHCKVNDEQTAIIDHLDLTIKATRDELEDLRTNRTCTANLQRELLNINEFLDGAQCQIKTLSEQRSSFEKQEEEKKQGLILAEAKEKKLKEDLHFLMSENREIALQFDKEVEELENKVAANKQEEHVLNSELTKFHEALNVKINEKNLLSKKLEDLQNVVATNTEYLTQKETELSNLKESFNDAQKKENNQILEAAAQTELIHKLQSTLDELNIKFKEQKEGNKNVIQELKKKVNDLKNKQQEKRDALKDTLLSVQCHEDENRKLDADISMLKSIVSEREVTMKILNDELSQESGKYAKFMEDFQPTISQKENRIKELESTNENFSKYHTELKEKLLKVQNDVKANVLLIENLTKEEGNLLKEEKNITVEMEKQIEELTSSEETLRVKINVMDKQILDLSLKDGEQLKQLDYFRKELETEKSKLHKIIEEFDQKEKNLQVLRESLSKAEELNREAAEKVSELTTKIEREENDMTKAREDSEENKELYLRDLKKFKSTCKDRASEICALNLELSEQHKKLSVATKELKEGKENTKLTEDAIQQLGHTLEETQGKLTHAENQLRLLQSQIKSLETEKERATKTAERVQKILRATKKKRSGDGRGLVLMGVDHKTDVMSSGTSSQVTTASSSTPGLNSHSILKPTKPPTPQHLRKSVSFTLDDDASSSSSIILQVEDSEALERNPAGVSHIVEKHKAMQKAVKHEKRSKSA